MPGGLRPTEDRVANTHDFTMGTPIEHAYPTESRFRS